MPVEYMPRAAQAVTFMMPNRHYTTIVRGIILKGWSLADLWPQVLVLYTLVANRLKKGLELAD